MKKLLCAALFTIAILCNCSIKAQTPASKNMTLMAHMDFGYKTNGTKLSNIWSYAKNGKEYALVGTMVGMTIVDVTNPSNPVRLFDIPGETSIWREIKTMGDYAYVASDASHDGLTIVDLRSLPSSAPFKRWRGDAALKNNNNGDSLLSIHALHIDDKHVYLYGCNLGQKGAIILNLNDPWNPKFAGQYDKGGYIHDGFVRDNILYASHIYAGVFAMVNVLDKANGIEMGRQETPSKFTHNNWLTDNSQYLLTTDEVDDSYLGSFDISNSQSIKEVDRIQNYNAGKKAIVHNTHVLNDYAITSWYSDGVTIVDASRPANLVEVGYYDTSPLSGNGFKGCWGVCPFLPSGTIVASDMEEGLFVLKPSYKRACYFEGTVKDSVTGQPIFKANVELYNMLGERVVNEQTPLDGSYKIGVADQGTYKLKFSKLGYADINKTVSGTSAQVFNFTAKMKSGATSLVDITTLNFSIYPNPSAQGATLELSDLCTANSSLSIYNAKGQIVETVALEQGQTKYSFGKKLVPGLYTVRYTAASGQSVVKRWIKL